MKFASLLLAGFMMSGSAMAVETKLASCLLNRSVNLLVVQNYDEEEGTMELRLIADQFGRGQSVIAAADRGDYSLVKYGNTMIAVIDHGRSGYAMFHVAPDADGKLVGNIDINLFDSYDTNGLRQVICTPVAE